MRYSAQLTGKVQNGRRYLSATPKREQGLRSGLTSVTLATLPTLMQCLGREMKISRSMTVWAPFPALSVLTGLINTLDIVHLNF